MMRARLQRGWLFAALLGGLAVLAVAATRGIWVDMLRTGWEHEEQSHILLAAPVAVWLVWLRRERFRRCTPMPSLLGSAIIAAGWGTSWFGFRSGVDIAWHGGALIVLVGALTTVLGPAIMSRFIPALGALLFLLPVPGRVRQHVSLPLQEASAWTAQFLFDLFGAPVVRAGNVLTVNGHAVAVAEACNGMRMVSAMALVTFAFVFSVPLRNSARLVLLLASPVVALAVNVIRLVPTATMFGYADHGAAEAFHAVGGWGALVVSLLILWGLVGLLSWLEFPLAPYGTSE